MRLRIEYTVPGISPGISRWRVPRVFLFLVDRISMFREAVERDSRARSADETRNIVPIGGSVHMTFIRTTFLASLACGAIAITSSLLGHEVISIMSIILAIIFVSPSFDYKCPKCGRHHYRINEELSFSYGWARAGREFWNLVIGNDSCK